MGDQMETLKRAEPSKPVSKNNAMNDVEIEPLTKKPYFHVTLCKSHVASPFLMTISADVTKLLPNKNIPVILARGKRRWEGTYRGKHPTHKRIDIPVWKKFVTDNTLRVGDVSLFELLKCTDEYILFRVQVLRGNFPSELVKPEDGSVVNPVIEDGSVVNPVIVD